MDRALQAPFLLDGSSAGGPGGCDAHQAVDQCLQGGSAESQEGGRARTMIRKVRGHMSMFEAISREAKMIRAVTSTIAVAFMGLAFASGALADAKEQSVMHSITIN